MKSLSARALYMLKLFENPDQLVGDGTKRHFRDSENNGWNRLCFLPMLGVKTATELVEANILEERYPGLYRKPYDAYRQEYRLAASEYEDFGDLWVPA